MPLMTTYSGELTGRYWEETGKQDLQGTAGNRNRTQVAMSALALCVAALATRLWTPTAVHSLM